MRTHPQLSFLVHGLGTDLHFKHLAIRADNRRVQRAIAILFGVGNVVVKLVRDMPPQAMDYSQCGITVTHLRHQNTNGAHVIDLTEVDAFTLHLPPDGVDMLGTAGNVAKNGRFFQRSTHLRHDSIDVFLPVETTLIQQLGNLLVLVWLQITEREIFQLPLDVANAQAVG